MASGAVMPLYDFQCKKCEYVEEHLVKLPSTKEFSFDIQEPIVCSKCGSDNVQRLVGSPIFHLKGGGWAKDNYSSVQATPEKIKKE